MVRGNKAQVVRKGIGASRCAALKKKPPDKETAALHIQPRSAGIIGVHVKLVNVPLDARFVCRRGVELMEPRTLQSAVPGKLGSAAGKGRQSLQIRVFFREVGEAVAQETLIAVAEAMI